MRKNEKYQNPQSALKRDAEMAIQTTFRLDDEQWQAFQNALNRPAEPREICSPNILIRDKNIISCYSFNRAMKRIKTATQMIIGCIVKASIKNTMLYLK